VLRDIEVQDFSTVVANNKEAVEQVEGEGWYAEEVHGGNGFTVIVQKSQPTLGRLRVSGRPAQPAGDGSLRHIKAQHA